MRRKIPLFVLVLTTVHAIESVGKASQRVAFYYFSLLPRVSHLTHLAGPQDSAQWSCSPPPPHPSPPPLMSSLRLFSPPGGSPLPAFIHVSISLFLNACTTLAIPSLGALPSARFVITVFPFLVLPSFISLQ